MLESRTGMLGYSELCTVPFECLDLAHDGAGVGDFSASIKIGGHPSGEVLRGPRLLNPAGALAVMVVRYHGSALRGMIRQQISTFDGGSAIYNCADLQLVVHET